MQEPIDFVTLFRDPGRDAYYQAPVRREPFFEPATRAWIVSDPEQARDFLTSPNLSVPPYADDVARISKRFSVDLEATSHALGQLALANNGATHANLRRRMTEFLTGRQPAAKAWFRDDLRGLLEPFFRPGRMEAMSAVVEPMVAGLMGTLVGAAGIPETEHESPSLLLDRSAGVPRRQRINRGIEELRQHVREHLGSSYSEADIDLRVAGLVIGKDPVAGSVAYSLTDIFTANRGERLCDVAFPDGPVATGVPHVERIVETSFEYAGQQFVAGQNVLVVLQSLEYVEGEIDSHRFFGAGLHACVGRPISMALWRAMIKILATSPLRVNVLGTVPKSDNNAFATPLSVDLELFE